MLSHSIWKEDEICFESSKPYEDLPDSDYFMQMDEFLDSLHEIHLPSEVVAQNPPHQIYANNGVSYNQSTLTRSQLRWIGYIVP